MDNVGICIILILFIGKTMQLVSFIDVFLTHTVGRSVLCIVPINTIQNWLAEFNYWLPAQGETSPLEAREEKMKHRDFPIYLLNDTYKNLQQRANVISEWGRTGGEEKILNIYQSLE